MTCKLHIIFLMNICNQNINNCHSLCRFFGLVQFPESFSIGLYYSIVKH